MIDCFFISYHKPGSKGKHFYDVFMQKYMYVCQFIRWLFVTLKGKLWWLGQWWRRAGSLLPQGTQQVWQFMWWSHEYYGLCTWCYAGSKQNLSLFLFLSLSITLSLSYYNVSVYVAAVKHEGWNAEACTPSNPADQTGHCHRQSLQEVRKPNKIK